MKKILIVFSTNEGQTEKIAHRIGDVIRAASIEVEVCEVAQFELNRTMTDFSGVIVGGSVHRSQHSPELAAFICEHLTDLNSQLSGFFSVSLSAAGTTQQRQDAQRCMERFLDNSQWQPSLRTIFAGALPYREYRFFKRILMRMIVSRAGGDTDTSKNYEYTDWDSVEEFAVNSYATYLKYQSPKSARQ